MYHDLISCSPILQNYNHLDNRLFDAILTSRQTCEKLQCLYENLMSNNFHKTAFLKKISIVNKSYKAKDCT